MTSVQVFHYCTHTFNSRSIVSSYFPFEVSPLYQKSAICLSFYLVNWKETEANWSSTIQSSVQGLMTDSKLRCCWCGSINGPEQSGSWKYNSDSKLSKSKNCRAVHISIYIEGDNSSQSLFAREARESVCNMGFSFATWERVTIII